MATDQVSNYYCTLHLYRYFFEFFKTFGIFPFKLNLDSKTKRLKEISYHRNGPFYVINNLAVLLLIFSNLLAYIALIRYAVLGIKGDFILGHESYTMTISFVAIVLLTINLKKAKVCRFLNKWILVEEVLIRGKAIVLYFNKCL